MKKRKDRYRYDLRVISSLQETSHKQSTDKKHSGKTHINKK